ncbi:hypothetical protein Q3G72_016816 [Acer saccharum]|nr:hypothetical protein Q3G72_016816 [Acer saccharum]
MSMERFEPLTARHGAGSVRTGKQKKHPGQQSHNAQQAKQDTPTRREKENKKKAKQGAPTKLTQTEGPRKHRAQ